MADSLLHAATKFAATDVLIPIFLARDVHRQLKEDGESTSISARRRGGPDHMMPFIALTPDLAELIKHARSLGPGPKQGRTDDWNS